MAADEKWYFTKDQLANTPSRKYGYDADRELSCRQQAANFIQDMGQRLQVTQLCINTAIVYMHRFYVFHSFSHFHRNDMAVASLFLAAKVEEQPRKLEHVIKVAQMCLHREQHQARPVDTKSEQYLEQAQDLVINENILLQTLGFDVAIDHPHTHVVKCCHLVRASKDLAQTSYFMASNSLHLTTMCLLYKPTVVACFCIHLACKWSNWEIPQSNEGKSWFWYVDRTVTQELLEQLTEEFLRIFDKCSSRLKRKITSISATHNLTLLGSYPFQGMDRKRDGQQSNIPNFHAQPVQQPQSQPFRSRTSGAIIGPPRTIVGGGDDLQKRLASTLGPLPQAPQSPSPSPQTHQKTPSLDFKKTTPTTHHSRDTSYSGSSGYHDNGTPSNSNAPNSSTPSSSASYSSESPSMPPSTKHSSGSRPEYIFPPPTRSTHHSGPPRTEKQDRRSPIQQSHYKPSHPVTHHPSRNGTSHSENSIPPDAKTFTVNHLQKNHVKGHDAPRQMPGVISECVSVNHRSSSDVKTIINSVKTEPVLKTEPFSSFSVQPPVTRQPPPPPPPVSLPPPSIIPTKPSSIFSPEKVTPPSSNSPKDIKASVPVVFNSTIKSPTMLGKIARNRTSSSSSEPELVPFMTKLEDMTGFENIGRGKTTAIKLTGKVPDLIPPREKKKESMPVISTAEPKGPDLLRPFPVSDVIETVAFEQVDTKEKAHKKKKKRKEHKEHKDRDKDKDKKKHKEKHRVKHSDPAPIKITIPKDKLNQILPLTPSSSPSHDSGHRLKIKIPKEKLLTPTSGLKIKISSKDGVIHSSSKDRNHSSSRKRERTSSHDDERPSKTSRQSRPNEQITSTNDSM